MVKFNVAYPHTVLVVFLFTLSIDQRIVLLLTLGALIVSVVVAKEVDNGAFVFACCRQPTETAISKIEAKTTTSFSIFYHSPIRGDKDYAGLAVPCFM
jgi:hypothetical protein